MVPSSQHPQPLLPGSNSSGSGATGLHLRCHGVLAADGALVASPEPSGCCLCVSLCVGCGTIGLPPHYDRRRHAGVCVISTVHHAGVPQHLRVRACVLHGCVPPTRSTHSAPACSHACLRCTVGCACLAVTTGQRLASSSAWRRFPSPLSRTSSARRWMASRPFGRSGCRYAGGVLGATVRLPGRPRHLFRQSNEQRTMCGCVDDNNQVYVVGRMADQVRPTSAVQCHAVHASLQRSPLTVRLSLC